MVAPPVVLYPDDMDGNGFFIEGYSDACVKWGAYCPNDTPIPKDGVSLRHWALEGPARQITVELTEDSARIPATGSVYVFCMHLDAASRKQGRALMPRGEKQGVLGMMRAGRFDSTGALLAEKMLVVEGLDEQHLLDRLVSEALRWHAQDFGQGPGSPEGQRALAALERQGVLEAKLPHAPSRSRPRM